ncbi:hypothetical protein [Pontibacter harenae]|uniref:hypothetical protein n=1 Tax=Pontibacter harenae TaxID=2894083 RepID=UPI001E41406C|nr:hypothetical protein [Pontibacter harenae]MCC9167621.1 hypothetical protein [Pontibacter harenae]
MKPLLLLCTVFFVAFECQAQIQSVTDDNLDKKVLAVNLSGSDMLTVEMRQELLLNAEQYAQVEQLNKDRFKLLQDAESKYAHNPEMLSLAKQAVTTKCDKALESVLSEPQLRSFLELTGRQDLLLMSEIGK